MGRNRKLVTVYCDTGDSDVAATNEVDLGPYVHVGLRQVEGVWVYHDFGVASDTDHTFACKFQESATTVDSDFADITSGGFTSGTTLTEDTINQISFAVAKRYIRAYLTLGGTAVAAYNYVGLILEPRFDT